jgi:hypothetical protein
MKKLISLLKKNGKIEIKRLQKISHYHVIEEFINEKIYEQLHIELLRDGKKYVIKSFLDCGTQFKFFGENLKEIFGEKNVENFYQNTLNDWQTIENSDKMLDLFFEIQNVGNYLPMPQLSDESTFFCEN